MVLNSFRRAEIRTGTSSNLLRTRCQARQACALCYYKRIENFGKVLYWPLTLLCDDITIATVCTVNRPPSFFFRRGGVGINSGLLVLCM